jgi:hypothetical protein
MERKIKMTLEEKANELTDRFYAELAAIDSKIPIRDLLNEYADFILEKIVSALKERQEHTTSFILKQMR